MDEFIGREQEMTKLERLFDNRMANLVVVKGRRRIGKSRLIREFGGKHKFYRFMGLNPRKGITAQEQRNEFARLLKEYFDFPDLKANEWGDLFTTLAKKTQKGRIVILFDEISWMAQDDPDFLGKLKVVWESHFCKNSQLILILCGSVSSWIEENISKSTGYFGRPSLDLTLRQLPLEVCDQFWGRNKEKISAYEKLKVLSVTGGVPRYLELINPKISADENIRRLFFDKDSPLFNEYEKIFTEIYSSRNPIYRRIIESLVNNKATQEDISIAAKIKQTGDLSDYLSDLELGGFITRDFTWNIKTGQVSNLSYYRLSDNYMRFCLKYILPNKIKIEQGLFEERSLRTLPGWDTMIGLQFENLVLSNHLRVINLLGLKPDEIVFANPYFQRKTARMHGCQIDYLIQTRDCVYICEIKFNRKELQTNIIQEVENKLNRLHLPKYISRRAVLIHVNGVSEEVVDSLFFTKIIDFGELL